jgi:hypothetical protein
MGSEELVAAVCALPLRLESTSIAAAADAIAMANGAAVVLARRTERGHR